MRCVCVFAWCSKMMLLNKCAFEMRCIFFCLRICKERSTHISASISLFSSTFNSNFRCPKWMKLSALYLVVGIFIPFSAVSGRVFSFPCVCCQGMCMSYHIRYAFATRTQIHLAMAWRQPKRLFELDACQAQWAFWILCLYSGCSRSSIVYGIYLECVD